MGPSTEPVVPHSHTLQSLIKLHSHEQSLTFQPENLLSNPTLYPLSHEPEAWTADIHMARD